MRTLLLCLFGFAVQFSLFGQVTLVNGNFSSLNNNTGVCTPSTAFLQTDAKWQFQYNCVNGSWRASHGTPELCLDSFRSNQFAMMWSGHWDESGSIQGEGLFYPCTFIAGQRYKLSFKLSTHGAVDRVFIALANNLSQPPASAAIGSTYDVPSVARQLINTNPNINDGAYLRDLSSEYPTWSSYTVDFVPAQNYSQLWFYPYDGNPVYDLLYLDDVDFTSCLPFASYYSTTNMPGRTSVDDFITAGGTDAGKTPTKVLTGQTVAFQAGSSIQLVPGFSVDAGGTFAATIAPCSEVSYCVGAATRRAQDLRDISEQFLLYPNPTGGKLTLELFIDYEQEPEIEVYDWQGRLVKSVFVNKIQDNLYEIDVASNSNGLYFAHIRCNGKVITKKFILEK